MDATFAGWVAASFARHLESAYETMWDIWRRGERPRSFGVCPGPERDRAVAHIR